MPTQQELMIMRLVGEMKHAVKRSADESDSEESVHEITNRGNKLKKKAKFVREGQLSVPNGPQTYKKTILYNDFEREILSERPPLYDDDGYEMSSEDDEDGEAQAAANEFYPYNEVKIEELLAPLMSVGDLPEHPTLSRAFTSKTLTELTSHARLMAQKEKNALWRMKHLLTKLSGDHTWIPTAMLETPNDLSFFGDGRAEYRAYLLEKNRAAEEAARLEGEEAAKLQAEEDLAHAAKETQHLDVLNDRRLTKLATPPTDDSAADDHSERLKDSEDVDVHMVEAGNEVKENSPFRQEPPVSSTGRNPENRHEAHEGSVSQAVTSPHKRAENPAPASVEVTVDERNAATDSVPLAQAENEEPTREPETVDEHDPDTTLVDPEFVEEGHVSAEPEKALDTEMAEIADAEEPPKDNMEVDDEEDAEAEKDAPEPRRMRTRAQVQAATDDGPSRPRSLSAMSNESFILPYYRPPISSLPEHDFMLPSMEAEETRRLLQLYIQKQEEICRGAEKLYMGLLEADRTRAKVMSWARSEKHVGEMSDGEDWVDEEEWHLSEPLKKGQDEEEEDTVQTSKKTRTRRQ